MAAAGPGRGDGDRRAGRFGTGRAGAGRSHLVAVAADATARDGPGAGRRAALSGVDARDKSPVSSVLERYTQGRVGGAMSAGKKPGDPAEIPPFLQQRAAKPAVPGKPATPAKPSGGEEPAGIPFFLRSG